MRARELWCLSSSAGTDRFQFFHANLTFPSCSAFQTACVDPDEHDSSLSGVSLLAKLHCVGISNKACFPCMAFYKRAALETFPVSLLQ
eukprot:1895026-Amphidinium_carterae.6